MKESKRQRIIAMLDKQPHLQLIDKDVLNIAERIQEYDQDMFVLFNKHKRKFEIHSFEYAGVITNPIVTFQTTIPFDALDVRALHHLYNNDIRVHGRKILERVEKEEQQQEEEKKRNHKNWIQSIASETKSMFAKDAWTM